VCGNTSHGQPDLLIADEARDQPETLEIWLSRSLSVPEQSTWHSL
jgi:hypothetical protein